MDDSEFPADEPIMPRLWNPNAAANWSLLFTPAFGAILHAANWRALGRPERATTNMLWVWATVVFLVVNLGTIFLPDSKGIEAVMRIAGLGLLLGWYFSQGRAQASYVKETIGENYVRRGWGRPLLIGLAAIVAYIAVIFVLVIATYKPDPQEIADVVKPLILQEWQQTPELRDATIQEVALTHKGGNLYTGSIDATIAGQSQRLPLEVTHDGKTIVWEVKPPGH